MSSIEIVSLGQSVSSFESLNGMFIGLEQSTSYRISPLWLVRTEPLAIQDQHRVLPS